MANFNLANIKAPQMPNLPIAPDIYDRQYFNLLTNALRLYFTQLDLIMVNLITPDLGKYLNFPFIAALDTTVQTAAAPGVAYPISFNTPYLPFPVNETIQAPYLDPADSTKFIIPDSHYYNYNYTVNFVKATAGPATVAVWFTRNGTTYDGSTRYYTLLGGGAPCSANATVTLDELNGDEIQMWWTTSDIGVEISPTPGGVIGPEPTGASVLLSITFVSA